MSSVISKWTNRGSFVWTVEKPVKYSPRHSPSFFVFGYEFCLSLCVFGKTYYISLVPKCCIPKKNFPCFWICVRLEGKSENSLPLSSTKYVLRDDLCIWEYHESDILKERPDFFGLAQLVFLVDVHNSSEKRIFEMEPSEVPEPKLIRTPENKDKNTLTSLSCLLNLSKDLSKLLHQGLQTDVVLACLDRQVKAHSQVLRARSSVLSDMLEAEHKSGGGRTGQIEVKDIPGEIADQFVRYIYTGMLPDLSVDKARQFYEAAHKYDVPRLVRRCAIFLQENLMPDNACETLLLAHSHNDGDLKKIAIDYILEKEILLQDDHWLPFCRSQPLLANEVLNRFCKMAKGRTESP